MSSTAVNFTSKNRPQITSQPPWFWRTIRPKTPSHRVFLLGTVTYAFVLLFWSAHSIDAFTSRLENTWIKNKSRASLQKPEPNLLSASETDLTEIRDFPLGETRKRKLKCVGWRATLDCSPDGLRDPENDQNCTHIVSNGMSGYCEVEDLNSGERFRVMRRNCNSVRRGVPFRCKKAPKFVNFRAEAHNKAQQALQPSFKLPNVNESESPRDGIVMVVYPKLLASAYATIRVLRDVLHCQLPIEIWFRPDEVKAKTALLEPLRRLAANEGNMTFQKITDPLAKKYVAKIHAIYHSTFDRLLFLDADNVPVRDPSFLFESAELHKTGAIFWPDFWYPGSTIFGVHENSILWKFMDMPFVDMFEQESGQLVVDCRRHAAPLELVRFYSLHRPDFFST